MKKSHRAAVLFCVVFSCFLMASANLRPALGWGAQNEERFLEWYQEHKNTGGEFYLTGMLKLTAGTANDPIILDGTGKIKIYCGRNSIMIASPVVIDNPQLELISEASSGIVINNRDADLYLVSGALEVLGNNGIYWMSGRLYCGGPRARSTAASPSNARAETLGAAESEHAFRITVAANNSYEDEAEKSAGIYCMGTSPGMKLDPEFCGLEIEVSAPQSSGIFNSNGGVTITDSEISAYGTVMSHGIRARDNIVLSGTSVTAGGPIGKALVSGRGSISCDEDSCSISDPDELLESSYIASGLSETLDPVAVRVNSEADRLPLPKSVEIDLEKIAGSGTISRFIDIDRWDTDTVFLDRAGIYLADGVLSEDSLQKASASNALRVTVPQRVNVLDETGTFIDAIQFSKDSDVTETGTTIRVWCMYPEGALALYLEYSRDGEAWTAAEWDPYWSPGETNWLDDDTLAPGYDEWGRILLIAEIPYVRGSFGVRLRTVGGGVYEGVGKPSEVNVDDGTVSGVWNPGSDDDGNSGDRGGGAVEPETAPSKAAPLESGSVPASSGLEHLPETGVEDTGLDPKRETPAAKTAPAAGIGAPDTPVPPAQNETGADFDSIPEEDSVQIETAPEIIQGGQTEQTEEILQAAAPSVSPEDPDRNIPPVKILAAAAILSAAFLACVWLINQWTKKMA